MIIHTIFDFAAWIAAFAMSVFVARRHYLDAAPRTPIRDPGYFIALGLGAIAGAVAGAIVAVEIFKWRAGIRGSTGGQFVAPLAIGIAVGRLGCSSPDCPITPMARRPRRRGRWISATAFAGIRCSFMNRPR
jgi:hypothetical protein